MSAKFAPKLHLNSQDEIQGKNGSQMERLNSIMSSISIGSDELLFRERMWQKRHRETNAAMNCSTTSSLSGSIGNTTPNIQRAAKWSQEKNYWLSCVPHKHRVWGYTAEGQNVWEEVENPINSQIKSDPRINNKDLVKDVKIKSRQWETKVLAAHERHNKQILPKTQPMTRKGYKDPKVTQTLRRWHEFSKIMQQNSSDLQRDSRNLEYGTRANRRTYQTEMERLEEGYKALQPIYALNPQLVITLAQQHQRGGPGKKWMGLKRDDIGPLLKLLKNTPIDTKFYPQEVEFENQSNDFRLVAQRGLQCYSAPELTQYASEIVTNDVDVCQSIQDYHDEKKTGSGGVKMLKPRQLMPLHIPGPEELRRNVCVRAYNSTSQEGFNSDLSLSQKKDNTNSLPSSKTTKSLIIDNPKNEIEERGDEDEQGFSIESFIPFYSVTRN